MAGPAERIAAQAAQMLTATDDAGRVLQFRRLGALDRLRMFKALGAELALNAPYFGMAMLACSVTAIDGVPVPQPVTEEQVEGLVHRLGDGGIAAIAQAMEAAEPGTMNRAEQGN